jgi:hypothetical protein
MALAAACGAACASCGTAQLALWRQRARNVARLGWGPVLWFATAHHPACGLFEADVFRWGSRRLCVGCFTALPVLLVAFVLLEVLSVVPSTTALTAGLMFGSAQAVALLGWTRSRRSKIAVKVLLGLGLALTVYGIIHAAWPVALRASALVGGWVLAFLLLQPRARRMTSACAAHGHAPEPWHA